MQEHMDQNGGQGSPFTGGFFSFGPGGANYGSFGTNRSNGSQNKKTKPEGEVTIETPAEPQPHVNKKIGEYVDFEEVD